MEIRLNASLSLNLRSNDIDVPALPLSREIEVSEPMRPLIHPLSSRTNSGKNYIGSIAMQSSSAYWSESPVNNEDYGVDVSYTQISSPYYPHASADSHNIVDPRTATPFLRGNSDGSYGTGVSTLPSCGSIKSARTTHSVGSDRSYMYNDPSETLVYTVQYKRSKRYHLPSPQLVSIVNIGDYVKVEGEKGEDLGIVVSICTFSQFLRMQAENPTSFSNGSENKIDAGKLLRVASIYERHQLPQKERDEQAVVEVNFDA